MKVGTDGVLLGAWCPLPEKSPLHVADLGAGSGLIALMIAQRAPGAKIDAVEIDTQAYADCQENFRNSPFTLRLNAIRASATDYAPQTAPDLIVSNPPFFTTGIKSPSASRRSARHQDIFGPKAVIEIATRLLSPSGSLAMITPAELEVDLLFHARLGGLSLVELCRVSTIEGRPPTRLLWLFSRAAAAPHFSTLAIRDSEQNYTPRFAALTSPFYLDL